MARPWWTFEQELNSYLQELEEMGRAERTIKHYKWTLETLFKGLGDNGYSINPRKIGRKEADFIRYEFHNGKSPKYVSEQLKILKSFCLRAGNKAMAKIDTSFGNVPPTNVRWLTQSEAFSIRDCARGIERMVIHLELDLGLRRIEVIRLGMKSFQKGAILIHGKGRNGGKWRKINWHPETAMILEEYLRDHREKEIAKAKSKDPDVRIPDNLLIYGRKGQLHHYKKTAIDKMVKSAGERAEIFEVSNHDLRRSCGRLMYQAGVKIEVIAKIFGHSDTKTTIRYLGLDLDDMGDALSQYAKFMSVPKTVQIEPSQINGGPSGI
ncbi:MAG: tyrosine-type recombinase/integrase [Candidatus Thorarchaeota archaeon]